MNEHRGVNLYASYQRAVKQNKSAGAKKQLTFLPLLLLLLAVAVTYMVLWQSVRALQSDSDALDAQIAQISGRYAQAQTFSGEASGVDALYDNLETADALFTLYPALTPQLIRDVEDCAGEIFNVAVYGYEESNGTLAIDANAASVNEVPGLIERLRATNDFTSVQYTGYTSDTNGEYYCTVACVLPQGELYGALSTIIAENGGTGGEAGNADELPAE